MKQNKQVQSFQHKNREELYKNSWWTDKNQKPQRRTRQKEDINIKR